MIYDRAQTLLTRGDDSSERPCLAGLAFSFTEAPITLRLAGSALAGAGAGAGADETAMATAVLAGAAAAAVDLAGSDSDAAGLVVMTRAGIAAFFGAAFFALAGFHESSAASSGNTNHTV